MKKYPISQNLYQSLSKRLKNMKSKTSKRKGKQSRISNISSDEQNITSLLENRQTISAIYRTSYVCRKRERLFTFANKTIKRFSQDMIEIMMSSSKEITKKKI